MKEAESKHTSSAEGLSLSRQRRGVEPGLNSNWLPNAKKQTSTLKGFMVK